MYFYDWSFRLEFINYNCMVIYLYLFFYQQHELQFARLFCEGILVLYASCNNYEPISKSSCSCNYVLLTDDHIIAYIYIRNIQIITTNLICGGHLEPCIGLWISNVGLPFLSN